MTEINDTQPNAVVAPAKKTFISLDHNPGLYYHPVDRIIFWLSIWPGG